jgi:hypothetical protein
MEIKPTDGVRGISRVENAKIQPPRNIPTEDVSGTSKDGVTISEHARLLSAVSQLPDLRQEQLQRLKDMVKSGNFETQERLKKTIEGIMAELGISE